MIIKNFEKKLSLSSPQYWTNDVAMGVFDKPLRLRMYRVLSWDLGQPDEDDRLFLTGDLREGVFETSNDVASTLEGIFGGRRYMVSKKTSYSNPTTIIWRTRYPTVSGFSGSALVRAGDLLRGNLYREWKVLGFQSHEYNAKDPVVRKGRPIYWKIAYRSPEEIMGLYPIAPHNILHYLDQIYANRFSLP